MGYTINRTFQGGDFGAVVEKTRAALSTEGFGVLTEIDVKATLKKKIGADVDDYLILGACNPNMAHKAMQIEPRVGAMLPCNVIVQETESGKTAVAAIDPLESMKAIENPDLEGIANQIRSKLEKVVKSI